MEMRDFNVVKYDANMASALIDDGKYDIVWHGVDEPEFRLGGLRIFILVDHVLADGFVHQPVDLPFLERRTERGKIQPRIAVDHQFVVNQLIHEIRHLFLFRTPVLFRFLLQDAGCVNIIPFRIRGPFSEMQSHFSPPFCFGVSVLLSAERSGVRHARQHG